MKMLFVGGLYPINLYTVLQKYSKYPLQNAPNVFQWALVDGLLSNKVDVDVVSCPFLPSFPGGYSKIYAPPAEIVLNGNVIGKSLKYNTLAFFKQCSIRNVLFSYAKDWCEKNKEEKELHVLVYTTWPEYNIPIIKLKEKYPNIVITTIVTDLIDDALNFDGNKNFLKKLQISYQKRSIKKTYSKIDKYVLLTKYMVEKIPEAQDNNIVVEGIAKVSKIDYVKKRNDIKQISYTGGLHDFVGIREFVDAFMKTDDPSYRLVICGSGENEKYIKEKCKIDNRIVYKGNVTRDEAVKIQMESLVVVNPRRPDSLITRYSFPSKTMEYLSSMTPMIGYHLEGIPEEYYDYMYTPKDLSKDSMTQLINEVLNLPLENLEERAKDARSFIVNNKSSYSQVKRILGFLCE